MQKLQEAKQAAENISKMQLAARVQQEEQADRNAQLLLQVRAHLPCTVLFLLSWIASRVGPTHFAFVCFACYCVC